MDSLEFTDLIVNPPLNFIDAGPTPPPSTRTTTRYSFNNLTEHYEPLMVSNRPASQSPSPEPLTGNTVFWDNPTDLRNPSTSTPISATAEFISKINPFPIKLPTNAAPDMKVVVGGVKGRGMKVPRIEAACESIPPVITMVPTVIAKTKFRTGVGRGTPTILESPLEVSGQFSDVVFEIIPPPRPYANDYDDREISMEPNFCDGCFGKVIAYEINMTQNTFPTIRNGQKMKLNDSMDSGGSSSDGVGTMKNYHRELKLERKRSRYVDTHCHLDLVLGKFKDPPIDYPTLKSRCDLSWSPAYAGCITDFCFPPTFLNDKSNFFDGILGNDDVWAAIGCHPKNADGYDDVVESFIIEKCRHPKVVAFGELGLDYSFGNKVKPDLQKKILERQLDLGVRTLGKPLLLHCRDAAEDCLNLFKCKVPPAHPIHFHCFTYGYDVAEEWMDYFTNLYFGITPAIFSPRNSDQENFYKNVPLNRVLIETDAPYFLPAAYRNKGYGSLEFNHPGLGALVAIKLAEIRKENVNFVFDEILSNTKKIYKLDV